MSNPIRFDDIPIKLYLPPTSISKNVNMVLKGLAVQSVLLPNSTQYGFNFTGTPYTDRSLISVYKL